MVSGSEVDAPGPGIPACNELRRGGGVEGEEWGVWNARKNKATDPNRGRLEWEVALREERLEQGRGLLADDGDIHRHVLVLVDITATAKAGYSSLIGDEARQAVFDYINALKIGEDLERLKLFMPAQLFDSPNSDTFALSNVLISIKPAATGTGNVVAAINQRIRVLLADITFVAS